MNDLNYEELKKLKEDIQTAKSELFNSYDIDLLAELGMSPEQAVGAIMKAYKEAADDDE